MKICLNVLKLRIEYCRLFFRTRCIIIWLAARAATNKRVDQTFIQQTITRTPHVPYTGPDLNLVGPVR